MHIINLHDKATPRKRSISCLVRNRESASMDALLQRRDDQAEVANVLVGAGLAVAAAGLLWYWLGDE